MPTWAAFLAGVASAITIGTVLVRVGAWGGHQDGDIARLEDEVRRLRDWRHRIGEDPCDSILKLYVMLEKDIEELRKRIYNGHTRP